MAGQSSFPNFSLAPGDEKSSPSEMLFFAIRPDMHATEETTVRYEGVKSQLRLRERLRRHDLLHVTLCDLYKYGDSEAKNTYVDAALAAAAGLRFRRTPVTFDRTETFGGGAYVLTGNNESVVELGKRLAVLLSRAGLPAKRPGRPHMTLLFSERPYASCEVPPVTWIASEVVLIRSYLGQSRHEHLGAIPLETS